MSNSDGPDEEETLRLHREILSLHGLGASMTDPPSPPDPIGKECGASRLTAQSILARTAHQRTMSVQEIDEVIGASENIVRLFGSANE